MKTAVIIALGLALVSLVVIIGVFLPVTAWVAACTIFGLVCAGNPYAIALVAVVFVLSIIWPQS